MGKIALILLSCWTAGLAFADEASWQTDLSQAAAQASREGKLLLLDFTGSDWCGWCKKLDAETFSKPEFLHYAKDNLVLVQVDFPRQRPQPEDVTAANKALQDKYEVRGFPTLIVLKPDGTVLWKKVGYMPGGPSAMIAKIAELRGKPVVAKESAPQPGEPKPAAPAVPIQWPAPPVSKPGDAPRLQGILYSSHPSVILEGKNCEEGDSVKGMRVLKILRDKVTVEWQGKVQDLTVN